MASAPTWKMADAPKGTLPLRQMTSREGGYDPESVYVPAFGYEHHGSEFLHKKHTSIVQQFYEKSNQRLIVDSVLKYFEKQHGSTLTASQISSQMVNIAMRKAFEIYGTSPENVSQARVGPSESLTYESQAPPSLYDIDYGQNDELAKLNVLSATLLRENIISERALLGRYKKIYQVRFTCLNILHDLVQSYVEVISWIFMIMTQFHRKHQIIVVLVEID